MRPGKSSRKIKKRNRIIPESIREGRVMSGSVYKLNFPKVITEMGISGN